VHHAHFPARAAKLLRYGSVSAIATATSLTVLTALVSTRALTPGWANIVATAVGTVPSFELNRRWVWGRRGHRSLGAEVGPFWVLSFAGLAISTVAVSAAGRWVDRAAIGGVARTLTLQGANLAAFGSLWIAQFFILDRVLFRGRAPAPAGA
jgi:putative flippase GtrA